MRSILTNTLLMLCCGVAAAQGFNMATQPSWPTVVKAGTPIALGLACDAAHRGETIQNSAVTPNQKWHCETSGWALEPVEAILNYRHYSDSVGQGDTLASDRGSYPQLIAQYLGVPVVNRSVSGITTNGIDPLILADLALLPQDNTGIVGYSAGRNNINVNGNSTNQGLNMAQDVLAQGAVFAIPNAQWINGNQMTYSGSHAAGVFPISQAMSSGNASFTTQAGTTLYVITVMQQTGTGAATISIDGVTQTQSGGSTLYFGGIGGTSPYLAQMSLSRFSGLTNTVHTVSIGYTSGTVEVARAVAFGGASHPTWPIVLMGNTSPLNPNNSDPYLSLYLTPQNAAYAQLVADGLTNLYPINLNDGTLTGTSPLLFNDQYHPTWYAQRIWRDHFIASLLTKFPQLIAPSVLGDVLTNNAQYGMGNMLTGWRSRPSPQPTANYITGYGSNVLSNITTGANVTAFGNAAGASLVASSNMTFLGAGADQTSGVTYVNSAALGAFAVVGCNNCFQFGNSSVTSAFLGNFGVLTTNNAPPIFGPSGNQFFGTPHIVIGSGTLASGAATITITGSAVYTGTGTAAACFASDVTTLTNPINCKVTAANMIVLGGTGTDSFTYYIVGN